VLQVAVEHRDFVGAGEDAVAAAAQDLPHSHTDIRKGHSLGMKIPKNALFYA
jgi:hypothetical protein